MTRIERPTPNSARVVLTYPVAPEPLLTAFRKAVVSLPRWSLEPSAEGVVNATRTTRIFRFRDDVKVRVYADETGSEAELTSAARIGKGDLGQNPRNLKELLEAVDHETGDRDGPAPQSWRTG